MKSIFPEQFHLVGVYSGSQLTVSCILSRPDLVHGLLYINYN